MAEKAEKAEKGKKKEKWIAGAIGKPGALHRQMGIPQGRKIPSSRLATAAKSGGVLGQRARLAQTLKGFHKGNPSQGQSVVKEMGDASAEVMDRYSNNPCPWRG
jgi:hypothetical protein